MKIPFESAESASLACEVLNVDSELRGSGIKRDISTDGENLLMLVPTKFYLFHTLTACSRSPIPNLSNTL